MKRPVSSPHLRAFRWPLAAVERKMDAALENARLAVHALRQEVRSGEQAERLRHADQLEQEGIAFQWIQRDPLAGAEALRYLASLQAARVAADSRQKDLEARLATARATCAERQRQLESVQALRDAAQRAHVQDELRRTCRDADAAWLALAQHRRATALRGQESGE